MMPEDRAHTPGTATEAYEKSAASPIPIMKGGGKKKRCSPRVLGNTLIGVGILLVIISVSYGTALAPVITGQIEDGVAVCKDSDIKKESYTDSYGDCKDCSPYYFKFSMFNVTNAEEHLKSGAKLQVKEVGPYTYRRREFKVDVKLEDNMVSYKTYTYHTYVPEKSCDGCSDKDVVISWDVGYLNVISQAGGEFGFLNRLVQGTIWGAKLEADKVAEVVKTNGEQMMRWVNGLNSNQPAAWKKLYPTVLTFLGVGVASITSLDLSGFEYNGVFAKRTISDFALGAPSMLAGLGLGTTFVKQCNVTGGILEQCAKCQGDECFKLFKECKTCALGEGVVKLNTLTCGNMEARYAAVYGAEEAKTFASATCGLCKSVGVCAAPLPGAVESSGLDFSKQAPDASTLPVTIQRTGCDDKSRIGEYIQYEGAKTLPIWAKLDKRRNPTLAELNAFAVYGNCANKLPNMTCSDVIGNDATSIKPLGASMSGFPDKVELQEDVMYLSQALQNITLYNSGEVYDDIDGIKLTRFYPPKDLLTNDPVKDLKGTGYPVDGVQPLAFNVGFLAYLSYPMFLWGDKSLTEAVEITMADGVKASKETMFDGDNLKKEYAERYQTIVDIEAGTGKTMRAKKRLMASYALAKSQFVPNAPMSDVVWPNVTAEVISPAYIGEETAMITKSKIDTYKTISGLLGSLIPVLIAGSVVGIGMVAGGFVHRRRGNSASAHDTF